VKILIVDDEKPARDRLSRMVGELGQHELVGEAVNGVEALGMSQSREPDIVLMDIRMPGMDGIEAARHIARLDEPPAVIFTSRLFLPGLITTCALPRKKYSDRCLR
jgi:two-component system response regulator AlgR